MQHCMIDLETLGTGTDAVILSIGAVKFNPYGDDTTFDNLYIPVDPASCQHMGMKIDAGTVLWWLSDDQAEGRKQLLADQGGQQVDLPSAIDGFIQWYGTTLLPVWSNAATFDIMIMRTAFRLCGRECPWMFWQERCFRTLKNLYKPWASMPAAHHALKDAQHQAKIVQTMTQQYRFTH